MKTTLIITVMLLVAMFAFSTPADAQFGSLNALRKQMGIKTKKEKQQEKALEEARRKQDSIQAYIKSITPTIPQPRADAKPIDVKWNKNKVGQWDPATLKLTFDMTYDEGEYAGKNIQYQLDPQTGKWTNIAGNVVGQMSNDGTMETPNLGTLKLNTQNNKVVWNGEVIGEATKTSAICYGTKMGEFSDYVSPLLMAYVVHGTMLSKDQVGKLKILKQQADEKAAAEAKARQEAAKKAAAQSSNGPKYKVLYYNGKKCEIDSNGKIISGYNGIGWLSGNRITRFSSGNIVGEIRSDGTIRTLIGNTIGEVRNGELYLNGSDLF